MHGGPAGRVERNVESSVPATGAKQSGVRQGECKSRPGPIGARAVAKVVDGVGAGAGGSTVGGQRSGEDEGVPRR